MRTPKQTWEVSGTREEMAAEILALYRTLLQIRLRNEQEFAVPGRAKKWRTASCDQAAVASFHIGRLTTPDHTRPVQLRRIDTPPEPTTTEEPT